MTAHASGPHIPAQWMLVTKPAMKAAAGELMLANSMVMVSPMWPAAHRRQDGGRQS
jgi:hypothetical protein